MQEAAALAGYSISGSSGADPTNKLRAARRVNMIKADIISRFGGKWDANYKEAWLALVPLYSTGTVTVTNGSRTVTGSGTAFTSAYEGAKFFGPDGCYYKVASVYDSTTLYLTESFQGTTASGSTYHLWVDEYVLYPEVQTVGGFIDYLYGATSDESWPRNMKESFPVPKTADYASVYTVIGRRNYSDYSTGTVAGSLNSNTITGTSTSWLANVKPGFEMTIGSYTYNVKRVLSDTSIELYQKLAAAATGSTYTARGKNAVVVRFKQPTSQKIVHYWYWSKDYPFVNDNDDDWISEMYPRVLINGLGYFDYVDKNDVARGSLSEQVYEDSIRNMKVACDSAMSGPRTLSYEIPDSARD